MPRGLPAALSMSASTSAPLDDPVKHDGLYRAAPAQYDADSMRFDPPVILKWKPAVPLLYNRVIVSP